MPKNSSLTKNTLKTRMGKRLKALHSCLPVDTAVCYDLCCDHGALGRAVLESQPNCRVVFNDIHPDIMSRLADLLNDLNAENFAIEVQPAEHTHLQNVPSGIIFLAGVGDEQCVTILRALLTQPEARHYRFVVSPATKTHFVRRFLNQMNVDLIRDHAVTENKRTYEIIEFHAHSGSRPVSLFGECWLAGNSDHQAHLQKLIQFYSAQLKQQTSKSVSDIVLSYQNLLKKIS